jgi:hypothetical protein
MKIIVLQGMPNLGKTTTLNLVWDTLINNGGTSTNRQPLGGDPNDFSDIVAFNNQMVAFYTMGDYSNYLANGIYDYSIQNCALLICALSINTPKVRANNAIIKFVNVIINKTIASSQLTEQRANTSDANKIVGSI